MDQKQFKITKLPREKLGNRAFSLWNEIELREKLKIIEYFLSQPINIKKFLIEHLFYPIAMDIDIDSIFHFH